jgi:hypothetical protein
MAAVYPGALPTIAANKSDDTDSKSGADLGVSTTTGDHAAHHNKLAEELVAIATELGINPSASFADVTARLNGMTTVRKTADQTMTGTALVSVTDLVFPIPAAAGGMYTFDFTIPWTTTAATNGLGVALTFPALGTGGYCSAQVEIPALAADGAAAHWFGSIAGASGADTVLSTAAVATATVYIARCRGILYAGSTANTAGNLQLQCRSEATAGGTVVKAGAHGVLWTG